MKLAAAFRGEILHYVADPADSGERAYRHIADGLLVVANGHVRQIGDASAMLGRLPPGTPLTDYTGRLIMPGFIDTHTHYAQIDVIASHGAELLEWLDRYTFPAEQRFADAKHAAETAEFFLAEMLRGGTTTAMVFATVYPASVDALFHAAERRKLRLITGKVMMDRNCPEALMETPESGFDTASDLIEKWHGRERLGYAITPRFAPSSSERQLEICARLMDAYPGVFLQSHAAENPGELDWVAELFPWSRSYLDVYDRFGLLRRRSVYAHCIHIDDEDRRRLAASGAAVSFCASSNLFLGSGLFDAERAHEFGVKVGLGSDVGAGTSLCLLKVLADSYKALRLRGESLSPLRAFYLATLGGAEALGLGACIGNFAPGKEADFIVLDLAATPLLARRIAGCATLSERLFALMMLGDERSVAATYVLGERVEPRTIGEGPQE